MKSVMVFARNEIFTQSAQSNALRSLRASNSAFFARTKPCEKPNFHAKNTKNFRKAREEIQLKALRSLLASNSAVFARTKPCEKPNFHAKNTKNFRKAREEIR
jgi:hypothetical protein